MTDFKERMMEMHWRRMREEYENRMRGNRLDEMSRCLPEDTGLPAPIWIDDVKRNTQHGQRIKFDPMNGTKDTNQFTPIPISLNPVIKPEYLRNVRTKKEDINTFVKFAIEAEKYRLCLIKDGKKPEGYWLVRADFDFLFQKNLKGELFS